MTSMLLDDCLGQLAFAAETLADAQCKFPVRQRPLAIARQLGVQEDLNSEVIRCSGELAAAGRQLAGNYPHFGRHLDALRSFWRGGSYLRSVFIMTKFPDTSAQPLHGLIQAVCDAVKKAGFVPRLGSDRDDQAQIWDNVEVGMLGSRWGIAVLENRTLEEFNPNVAAECGFMRALGRDVLLLQEKTFPHLRADFIGFVHHPFDWGDPESVNVPVQKWPTGRGVDPAP